MNIQTYQAQQRGRRREAAPSRFATVGQVYEDGMSLVFDEDSTTIVRGGKAGESAKHYKALTVAAYAPGMRVAVQKVSGTYLILGPLGGGTV